MALPQKKSREWHWALMDYGAFLKSSVPNPNRRHKNYSIQSKFEGSLRQIRGATLKILSVEEMSREELIGKLKKITLQTEDRVAGVLQALENERLITEEKNKLRLA
jgi:A/G-specific adenine glycosylase